VVLLLPRLLWRQFELWHIAGKQQLTYFWCSGVCHVLEAAVSLQKY
jgi:hypothetical protein